MNPEVNKDMDFDYEDEYFDDEMDIDDSVQDRMLNTIKEMMEEGIDNRTDMPFADFIIAANLVRMSDRVPGNAKYLFTLKHQQAYAAQTVKTLTFYSVKENIHGDWIVSDEPAETTNLIGYLIGGAKVDMSEFYVEFSE